MKKCPYCAEKIQNEAIVCRFCGRDLRKPIPTIAQNPQTSIAPLAAKPKRSIWAVGAIWGLALAILVAVSEIHGGTTSLLEISFDFFVSFLGWWLVCTFMTWLWRKIGNRGGRQTLFIIGTIVVFCVLAVAFDILRHSVETPSEKYVTLTPTWEIVRTTPTSPPTQTSFYADCKFWLSIDSSYLGKEICIYGDVRQVYQWQGYRRINFSRSQDYIYILYPNPVQGTLLPFQRYGAPINVIEIDSCLMFKGVIRMDNTGLLYIKNAIASACDASAIEH